MGRSGTLCDALGRSGTLWDARGRSAQNQREGYDKMRFLMISETRKYAENLKIRKFDPSTCRPVDVWDALGRLGRSGTLWDALGRSGTLWDALGTLWGRSGTPGNALG